MTAQAKTHDPRYALDRTYEALEPKYAFTATTPQQARTWQRRASKALAQCVGFMDQPRTDLRPKTLEKVDRGSYVRHKVVIQTTENTTMPMYVLVPKEGDRPFPVVLALHGHGYGVKDIVGLWPDGGERRTPRGGQYQADFACALAERGFLVLAPEISCFGERTTDYSDLTGGSPPGTCHNITTYAMMLGGSSVGMRVWDGMRALDYAETLDQADSSRMGAMGISGGGLHTFFSAALDSRIKACVVSGYFCEWRQSILAMNHCTCNFVPGILRVGRLSDLAGLIAPRPCLVENADHDPIFPLKDVRRTVKAARKAWSVFGADDLLDTDFFEGRHQICGDKAYDFLAKHLA